MDHPFYFERAAMDEIGSFSRIFSSFGWLLAGRNVTLRNWLTWDVVHLTSAKFYPLPLLASA